MTVAGRTFGLGAILALIALVLVIVLIVIQQISFLPFGILFLLICLAILVP